MVSARREKSKIPFVDEHVVHEHLLGVDINKNRSKRAGKIMQVIKQTARL